MTTVINLSRLPPPIVVQAIDAEAAWTQFKSDLIAQDAGFEPILRAEGQALTMLGQAYAYRTFKLSAEFNDRAKGLLMATATGADLDNLAAFYAVERLTIQEADPTASPPIPEVKESDDALRYRALLSVEGRPAGATAAYWEFHALSVPEVRQARAERVEPGRVRVSVLGRDGDGTASPELVSAVDVVLQSDDVRELCATVETAGATIKPYGITASLTLLPGPGEAEVLAAVNAALTALVDELHSLGRDVTRAALTGALVQPGVQNVDLTSPAADIEVSPSEAAYCTGITVTVGGRDE